MNIEAIFKPIADALGFNFSIGDMYNQNQWLREKEKLPALLFVLPASRGGEITPTGFYKESVDALLMFVDHEPTDADGDVTNEIIERMRNSAEKAITLLNEARIFEPILQWSVRDVIKDMSIHCTGVSVNLTIKHSYWLCNQ